MYIESNYIFLLLITYSMLIIFIGTLLTQLELLIGKVKIIKKIKIPKIIKNNYIINRVTLFTGNTLLNLGIYLLVIYVFLVILNAVDITILPSYVLYLYIVMLPITLVLFINIGNKNKVEKNFRRIIIYLLLLTLIATKSYSNFLELIEEKEINNFVNYIIYLTLAIFTALDNLVKAISKDYKHYKESNDKLLNN